MKTRNASAPTTTANAPPKTPSLRRKPPSRAQHSGENGVTTADSELEMIGKQITEVNEFRKFVNALGVSTKLALMKAETAKAKKAAGGSKAVVDAAKGLDKEVGALRTDVHALLKNLETNKLDIVNGTLRSESLDLERSKATLVDFKARYTALQTTYSESAPTKRGRGQEGKPNVHHKGKVDTMEARTEEDLETLESQNVGHPGGESNTAEGAEVLGKQALAVEPHTIEEVRKKGKEIVPKGGRKRGRGSKDDESHRGSKYKKVKAINNESRNTTDSDLTPFEDSDGPGNNNNKPMRCVSPLGSDHNTVTEGNTVPTSILRPAEDVEKTSSMSVEKLALEEPEYIFLPHESPLNTIVDDATYRTPDEATTDVIDEATSTIVDEIVDEMSDDIYSEEEDEMVDSATNDSIPDTEGQPQIRSIPIKGDRPDDEMRLAAAVDVNDLQKHLFAQKLKLLTKKKMEVDATEIPDQPTPKEKPEASTKETKVYKRETLRAKWDSMNEKEKENNQAIAKQHVRDFLRNPSTYRIPVTIRAMIREVAEFCIPACQITRELALHVLENKYHNLFCIYHQTHDKAGQIHDRSGKGPFLVTGTPFSRIANEKPSKHEPQELVERRPGYMHCGCSEDEALLDFYWWKMAEATSPTTEEVEGWLDHRKMDPRTRTLMFNLFMEWTCMKVDDIYVGYPIDASFDAKMARYDMKIARLQEAKEEEKRVEDRRIKREEARRIREQEEAEARKKEKGKNRHLAI